MKLIINKKEQQIDVLVFAWNILFWQVLYTKTLTLIGLDSLVTISILIMTLLGMAIYLLNILIHKMRIEMNIAYVVPFFCLMLFIISEIVCPNERLDLYFTYYIKYVLPPLLVLITIKNIDYFLKIYGYFSVVVLLLLGIQPILGNDIFAGYMDFGFTVVLPSTIGIYILRKKYGYKWCYVLEVFGWFLSLVYSNRSTFLALAVLVILYNIMSTKNDLKSLRKWIIFGIFIAVIYCNINVIFNAIRYVINLLGYNSYSINKLYNMIIMGEDTGIFSGREKTYRTALQYIKESSLLGSGIGTFETEVSFYSHNIFIDFTLYWGLIGLIIGTGLILFCFFTLMNEKDKDRQLLILMFFCQAFPKLLLSDIFIYDTAFWCLVVVCMSVRWKNRKGEKNDKYYCTIL